jgi:hypothetical protein
MDDKERDTSDGKLPDWDTSDRTEKAVTVADVFKSAGIAQQPPPQVLGL